MTWLDAFLLTLAERLVEKLAARAQAELNAHLESKKQDQEREIVNEENVHAYMAAKDRKARIEEALNLLNRVKRMRGSSPVPNKDSL